MSPRTPFTLLKNVLVCSLDIPFEISAAVLRSGSEPPGRGGTFPVANALFTDCLLYTSPSPRD
eukprot:5716400-Alexandrium_andersonii.AAC.1